MNNLSLNTFSRYHCDVQKRQRLAVYCNKKGSYNGQVRGAKTMEPGLLRFHAGRESCMCAASNACMYGAGNFSMYKTGRSTKRL